MSAWIKSCRKMIDTYGLWERDNYRDELIFAMEVGAERELTKQEILNVDFSLMSEPPKFGA